MHIKYTIYVYITYLSQSSEYFAHCFYYFLWKMICLFFLCFTCSLCFIYKCVRVCAHVYMYVHLWIPTSVFPMMLSRFDACRNAFEPIHRCIFQLVCTCIWLCVCAHTYEHVRECIVWLCSMKFFPFIWSNK